MNVQSYLSREYENNYFYNNRGWVTAMTNSQAVFGFTNDYFKNGNVKQQNFEGSYNDNFTDNRDIEMLYTYDKSNRLLTAGKSHDYLTTNTYDYDGNITTMKRYTNLGGLTQDYNYTYYSNTNKLQKIYGSNTQYVYDANGNVILDSVNRNSQMFYDHRNLLTQLRHKEIVFEDSTIYVTEYFYDEAGNRIRKLVSIDNGSTLTPYKDEVYSRNVNGAEFVIYVDDQIKQTNISGLGNEGYLSESDDAYYYQKDHLGSVRAVLDKGGSVVSAQDYDAWGFILQGRSYESGISTYKFTGKERDDENGYDYFGVRYYDSRIGRWGAIDPEIQSYVSISPYSYAVNNPLKFIDPNGKKVYISGYEADEVAEDLETKLKIYRNTKTGELSLLGKYNYNSLSKADQRLYDAITSQDYTVQLISQEEPMTPEETFYIGGGAGLESGTTVTHYFNYKSAGYMSKVNSFGQIILHEILEGSFRMKEGYSQQTAHGEVLKLVPYNKYISEQESSFPFDEEGFKVGTLTYKSHGEDIVCAAPQI